MRSSTSPFRSRDYSGSSSQADLQLIIKSLERENNGLVEEINVLKNKGRKVAQLQDKIELVLKHNNQLLKENQRLANLLNQKKVEVESWKSKCDAMSSTKNAATQLQIKRYINQTQSLKERLVQLDHRKNLQIGQIKKQAHLQIQSIKRNSLGNAEKYELQIRKLKEYCDKKDFEISQVNMKIVRLTKETDFEIGKLKEEKDRLKSDLIYEQNQHKRQIQSLKSKFDYNFHAEIETLKKQHLNQIEALDYENSKLKEVINSKNAQIQQIWLKNNKVKGNYEDSLAMMQRQSQQLKDRLAQTQKISQIQLARLRDKLQGIKQSEVTMLKGAHSHQTEILHNEIAKLQRILSDRNAELQNISKQKNQLKLDLQARIQKGKAELQAQINQNRDLVTEQEQVIKNWQQNFKNKNQQMNSMEAYLNKQIENLSSQKQSINNLLQNAQGQLARERADKEQQNKKNNAEISQLKEKCTTLKDELQRANTSSANNTQLLIKAHSIKVKQLESSLANAQNDNQLLEKKVKELEENIQLKKAQIKIMEQKIQLLETHQKDLRNEARQANNRWDSKEKEFNRLLQQQIKMMENSRQNAYEQLNQAHQNKAKTFKHQIYELEREIEHKNKLLSDLKSKYEELVNKFQEIFSQRAAQKDLDIKIPGWLPDTLATKSLFDVFLKNKVIQYCS